MKLQHSHFRLSLSQPPTNAHRESRYWLIGRELGYIRRKISGSSGERQCFDGPGCLDMGLKERLRVCYRVCVCVSITNRKRGEPLDIEVSSTQRRTHSGWNVLIPLDICSSLEFPVGTDDQNNFQLIPNYRCEPAHCTTANAVHFIIVHIVHFHPLSSAYTFTHSPIHSHPHWHTFTSHLYTGWRHVCVIMSELSQYSLVFIPFQVCECVSTSFPCFYIIICLKFPFPFRETNF